MCYNKSKFIGKIAMSKTNIKELRKRVKSKENPQSN